MREPNLRFLIYQLAMHISKQLVNYFSGALRSLYGPSVCNEREREREKRNQLVLTRMSDVNKGLYLYTSCLRNYALFLFY